MTLFSPAPFVAIIFAILLITLGISFSALSALCQVTPNGAKVLKRTFSPQEGILSASTTASTIGAYDYFLPHLLKQTLPPNFQKSLAHDVVSVINFNKQQEHRVTNGLGSSSSSASTMMSSVLETDSSLTSVAGFVVVPFPSAFVFAGSFIFFLMSFLTGTAFIWCFNIAQVRSNKY